MKSDFSLKALQLCRLFFSFNLDWKGSSGAHDGLIEITGRSGIWWPSAGQIS